MITAIATGESGPNVLIIGLSDANIERLEAEPIIMREGVHCLPTGWEIFIFRGRDELAMRELLKAKGLIRPDTKESIDPRLE